MTKKILVAGMLLLVQISAFSCNVPVFRYALERWPVSPYRALVVKDSELSGSEKESLKSLEMAGDGESGMLNLVVWNPNKDELAKSGMAKQLPKVTGKDAMVHLFFPVSTGVDKPFWSEKLNKAAVKKIVVSDFRKKLIKKVLEGNSGIYVLLESGNKVKDRKVLKKLDASIKEIIENMELPAGVVATDGEVTGGGPADFDPTNQLQSEIPLMLAFTTLSLARKDDEVLVALLMSLGPEREEAGGNEPMVFAAYGRGRALVPMVGEEINMDNIGGIAYFFTGSCSCQMKALNPGTDLLLDHDWDRSVFGGDE
ncbi:MAG: hypothetical protein PF904_00120 [Kiritimatiellae bacterium]|jgi:hypothetical protein|nr:hypothetical protein [Kiritimatiellia bacterium]